MPGKKRTASQSRWLQEHFSDPFSFFKFFTRKPYNHVSLSGDITLSEMYSFCRVTSEKMKYLNSSIQ